MSIPSISDLDVSARKIVWNAIKDGNLKQYTPRLIRSTLEEHFHLERGALDAVEYKSAITAATKAALKEDPPAQEGEKNSQAEKQTKTKRKSDGTMKGDGNETTKSALSPKGKKKAKLDNKSENEGSVKKRLKPLPQKTKLVSDDDGASSSQPKRRKASESKEKQFKSAEHVPTSDMEQDEPDPRSTVKGEEATSSKSPKKDARRKESKDQESIKKTGNLPEDESGLKSESELSVLIDEPPKRKQKLKSASEHKELKRTRVKKEAPTLSKDEETIKRLKSLVVACGVRKVWAKVFQGLDTPQRQITKLKEILAELGMHGRLSIDQAKAVKQKRELAQELEDVQAFAKFVKAKDPGVQSRKSIESCGSKEEKEESGGEPDLVHKKRIMNARNSISAFLQDQSSDNE